MRRLSLFGLGVFLCAWAAVAGAEVVFDKDAASEPAAPEATAHPAIPSIVFVNPEARDGDIVWMPSSVAPFVPRSPVVLRAQPQNAPPPINQPSIYGGVLAHPPTALVANAALNAAHGYRFNPSDAAPCPPSFTWNLGIGVQSFFPRSFNCGVFNPYLPLMVAPPGFNRPTDRPSNAVNAARAVGQAHNYKFEK